MPTKICAHCNTIKNLAEFYTHPQTTDGYLGKCKDCCKKENISNRAAKREQYSLYEHTRNLNRRDYMHDIQKKHRACNPEKYKAHMQVGNAIRDGRLQRQPCQNCGNPNAQAHHHDYNKPLEVEWLCFKCHREIAHNQVVVFVPIPH